MKEEFMECFRTLFKKSADDEKRGVFFSRMLLWYTTCTIIVFLFFGTVMSVSVQKNYKGQIDRLNERAIAQSVSACTTTLRNLYNYYSLEIMESADLTELLLADEYSVELTMRFKKLRTMLINYSDMVESCYVINLKDDFIYSTLDTYRKREDFPDQDILSQLEIVRDMPGEYALVPRTTTFSMRGIEYAKQYISLILKKYPEGYLVVNLDYDAFADTVNYRNYNSDSQALLISSTGLVLADSKETMFGKSIEKDELYKKLREKDGKEGFFSLRTEGRKKRVLYCKNQLFGISYLILTDERLLGGNALLLQMILWAAVSVAVNLLLILFGTRILYRPIYRLRRLLPEESAASRLRVDEFEVMEQMFNKMRIDTRKYSQSNRKQMLKELLEGRKIQRTALNKEKEIVKEQLDRVFFLCVNMYPNEDVEQNPGDLLLMKFSMENIFRELLEKDASVECVDYENYITCIINMDAFQGEEGVEEDCGIRMDKVIHRALREMQEKMGDFFDIDVTCSVGSVVNSLDDIAESYEDALVAAFFQMTKEKNAILYNEVPEEALQEYPGETVKEILDGIKAGDQGKIRKEVSAFYSGLMSNSYHQALKNILMLEMEITKLEIKYDIYGNKGNLEYMEGLRSGGRLYKMREACLAHCLAAAESCFERRENNPNMMQIVGQVKELVEQRLTDPDLCINSIAQEIYLSAGYARTVFKEVTGQTLSNYIISRKLDMVCRLLKETDWSVQRIADHMGFSSRSYLYTFFKNYMGMTPNEYRKNS